MCHEGGYTMRIEGGVPLFYRPDGSQVKRAPATPPPDLDYVTEGIDAQVSNQLAPWDVTA